MSKSKFISLFLPSILLTFLIWLVYFIDIGFDLNLYRFGIFPRTLKGLIGIVTMPLIHGDIKHILNNMTSLFVLVALLFNFFPKHAKFTLILIWLISGLWTWVLARTSFHIGASALIYGIASFIFFAGVIIKEKRYVAISLLVVFIYGSIVWGIFPMDVSYSWEGHLTGFVSGIVIAFYLKKELKDTYMEKTMDIDDEDENDGFEEFF